MAEFQEVMRQWVRICNSVPGKENYNFCSDKQSGYVCPLCNSGLCSKGISEQTDEDIASGERTIMQWAAEHPEPAYPTWSEWLVNIGVFPKMMSTIPSKALDAISNGVCKPIPADIAKKLGIEPKEANCGT